MSDSDSGVDAGSDSNGSLSMSMGSSAPSDDENSAQQEPNQHHHQHHNHNQHNHHQHHHNQNQAQQNHHPNPQQNEGQGHVAHEGGHHHDDVHFADHEEDAIQPDASPQHPSLSESHLQHESTHHQHHEETHNQPSTSRAGLQLDFHWPMFSFCGSSLVSSSVTMSHLNSNWSSQQHDFSPKMKVLSRRPNVRFISMDISKETGEKKLRIASNTNDVHLIKKLLDEGVDPKSSDNRQRTALHFAASRGNTEVALLLLERGADPNQRDIIGNTPLHLAACTNHTAMITLLLRAGTNINALDNGGRTPLNLAQSKLKLIRQSKSNETASDLKKEVLQIVEMMHIYLQRSGKVAEMDLLSSFSNRFHLRQTKEEVDSDVIELDQLLTSLDHLSLQKKS